MTDKKAYDIEYNKTRTEQRILRLSKTNDSDIINHLRKVENFNAYVKALIRANMKGEKEK